MSRFRTYISYLLSMYLFVLVNRQICTIQYVSSIETWTEQPKVSLESQQLKSRTILPTVHRTPMNAPSPLCIPPCPEFTALSQRYLDFATGTHACVFGFTLRTQNVSTRSHLMKFPTLASSNSCIHSYSPSLNLHPSSQSLYPLHNPHDPSLKKGSKRLTSNKS